MVASLAMRALGFSILLAAACSRDPVDRVARAYVELQGDAPVEALNVLLSDLEGAPSSPRTLHLRRQLEARAAELEIANGRKLTFDEESSLLYGVVSQPPDESDVLRARKELDELLPGEGALAPRYALFQKRFLVSPEKLDAVLRKAIEESRSRTLANLDLPREERVEIEYVSGAPWPSFARYLGNYVSVVKVNRDFPLSVGSVLEIATHEAYPGHHALSVLLESRLVRPRALPEFSVEPLVGPDALLREGLATYGIELAFPGESRLRFEKDLLFPLAGLDPAEAERYLEVERRVRRLAPLRVEGARQYLDGKRDRVQSAIWLEERALVPAPWAFLQFVDRYRAYVVTYTAGPELVRRRAAGSWNAFVDLLTAFDHET
ncbi:MAG: hypothetical protein ACRD21_03910 [Vicinamibacteria bacterium]